MIDLYTVPLGTTARKFFAAAAAAQYSYDEALLVLPSRLLVQQSRRESSVQAAIFEYLPNRIIALNKKLLSASSDDRLVLISRRTQELLVGELLRRLDELNGLTYFTRLAAKEGFVKAVTGLLGQLSRSGATQEEITTVLHGWEERNPAYRLKDREIAALYNLYRTQLKNKNWYDVEGLYRLAIAVLENAEVQVPWQQLYFSEFYHFDPLQRLLLQALGQHCRVGVGLMYEPQRPELFAAVERSYGYLSGFAALQPWQPEAIVRTPALQHLAEHLGTAGGFALPSEAQGLLLLEAANRESELRAVVRSIKIQLQQGAAYSDFLIAVRDFNTYSGIRAICDEYGVPVTLPQTAALSAQPVCEFLQLLLTCAAVGSAAAAAYWRLLKCGVAQLVWTFDGEQLNRLKAVKFYNDLPQVQADVLAAAPAQHVQELTALQELAAAIPRRATVAGYGEFLQNTLQALALPATLGQNYRDGRAELCQVKNMSAAVSQLADVLQTLRADYENGGLAALELPAADFCRLLLTACAERQVFLSEADGSGILVGEAANLQGLLFKHVYILGLREGEFPRSKNENWIYSDSERGYLSSVGVELENTACAYAEDKFFFAAVAAMAMETLTLSWYSDDAAGASAYIGDVERLYAAGAVPRQQAGAGGWQQALSGQELLSGAAQIEPGCRWLVERLGADWPVRSGLEKLRALGSGCYQGQLTDTALLQAVKQAVGGEFSASNLETYAQCPFRFLLSYVWEQQQYAELTETVEPTVEGSLLHDVLARFLAAHLQEKLAKYAVPELVQQLDTIMTEVCTEYIEAGKLAATDFWPSQQRRLTLLLRRWLQRELAYQQEWEPFVPVLVEWDFGKHGTQPLALPTPDGKIYLNGRIDRIDSNGSGLFVTDYKRSVTPTGADLLAGLDLQMPVYLLALAALKAEAGVLGGGYYALKAGKRTGGFALQALGKTPFTVNNKPFSEAEDQWQAFADFCRTTIQTYVANLRAGKFPPAPRQACPDYCPGKDICRAYGRLVTEGGADNA